jgi:hypothetical protein
MADRAGGCPRRGATSPTQGGDHVHRRLGCTLAAAALVLPWAPAPASASDAGSLIDLEWIAPDGCPDAATIGREVDRLRADLTSAAHPYLRAHAEVQKEKSGQWRMELRTTSPQGPGHRTVRAESCRALADATALILALALPVDSEPAAEDRSTERVPQATTRPASENAGAGPKPASASIAPSPLPASGAPARPPPAPATAPPALASTPAVPASSASPAPASARSESPSLQGGSPLRRPLAQPSRWAVRLSAGAFAVLDAGTLPTVAPGVAGRLAATASAFPSLRLELDAALFQDETAPSPPARSATFALRTFDASGCIVTRAGVLEIGPCVSLEVAWLSAKGLYESHEAAGDAEWLVLRARATVAYPWSSAWSVRADVGGGLDLSRPEFVSEGPQGGLIDQPARCTGRVSLGIELRL